MGTSEGTVKSRLNYARKSIKAGVEDYERKGVKLYSASPILLLLFFLRREAESTTLDGAAAAAMAGRVLAGAAAAAGGTAAAGTAGSAAVASAGTGAAAGAAAPTAAAGISAKVVALILAAVVVLGGAVAVLVSHFGGQSGTGDGNAAQIGTSAGSGQAEALPTHAQVDVFDNRVTLVDTEGNLYMWGSWDESQNLLGAGSAEPQKIMEGIRWRVTTDGGVVLRYDTSAMTVAEAEAFLTGNVGA